MRLIQFPYGACPTTECAVCGADICALYETCRWHAHGEELPREEGRVCSPECKHRAYEIFDLREAR